MGRPIECLEAEQSGISAEALRRAAGGNLSGPDFPARVEALMRDPSLGTFAGKLPKIPEPLDFDSSAPKA